MSPKDDFNVDVENQWCPGCPNFQILDAFKEAFAEMGKSPHEICMVSGIGQAAKLPHYIKCNFFNGLHGRAVPVALGICTANPELTTLVVTGEGDCYGEGGNHFLHLIRRNPNMTVVVHNNEVYALTKGQASPTTPQGELRTLQRHGVEVPPVNMPGIAILSGCTFVARGYAGEPDHLKGLLKEAVSHRGLSYVDVVQPCITWGTRKVKWYSDRVKKLGEDHDFTDRTGALAVSVRSDEEIPIGILYKTEPKRIFGSRYREEITDRPLCAAGPPDTGKLEEFLERFRH